MTTENRATRDEGMLRSKPTQIQNRQRQFRSSSIVDCGLVAP